MEQLILNLMPDDRKAKSVGFLFFIVHNSKIHGTNTREINDTKILIWRSELLKEIFELTAGAWDDPVISEDLYNRMEAAISFNCGQPLCKRMDQPINGTN